MALALTKLFHETLDSPSTLDADIRNREFLARVMGTFQVDDLVLPVLARAMTPDRDIQVRRSALMSVALIAGRNFGQVTGQTMTTDTSTGLPQLTVLADDIGLPLSTASIDDAEIDEQLRRAAQDSESTVRQLAAYTLGVVSGPDSMEQLRVMLLDSDSSTRANAAIALARNAQVDGVPVILELVNEGATVREPAQFQKLSEEDQQAELSRRNFEEPTALLQCLTAVGRLWTRIPNDQQAELRDAVLRLQKNHESSAIRLRAGELLREIGSGA